MVTQTRQGPYTYADYLETPDDVRYELIEGNLIMAPSPIPRHQLISVYFVMFLAPFVRNNELGWIFSAPIDVHLSDTNLLQPDILFVSNERARIIGETNIQGAPDLVIEIALRRTQDDDRTRKRDLYERFSVLEYWMADPVEETVEQLRLENGNFVTVSHYTRADSIITPLLPGLVIHLDEIFTQP